MIVQYNKGDWTSKQLEQINLYNFNTFNNSFINLELRYEYYK